MAAPTVNRVRSPPVMENTPLISSQANLIVDHQPRPSVTDSDMLEAAHGKARINTTFMYAWRAQAANKLQYKIRYGIDFNHALAKLLARQAGTMSQEQVGRLQRLRDKVIEQLRREEEELGRIDQTWTEDFYARRLASLKELEREAEEEQNRCGCCVVQ